MKEDDISGSGQHLAVHHSKIHCNSFNGQRRIDTSLHRLTEKLGCSTVVREDDGLPPFRKRYQKGAGS